MLTMQDDKHAMAQAVHDLGSALWFGGSTMGVVGVNSAGRDLKDGSDRIRVASSAWGRFAPAQWAGIAATLLAGIQLTRVGGRRIALQKGFGTVGAAKAALAVAGAAATAYAAYCGKRIADATAEAERMGEPVDVTDATTPTERTPERIAKWQRQQRVAQFVGPVLAGANIAAGSHLVQSYRAGATAKGVLGRLLPN
ncbi:hypothetical protein [Actinoplanes teichomyceticus]|uniref:Uncharacterized protein n=1 Tax=Actinoplanes teichomyceticus TaxID=1867 RepID=A0A561WBC1_ACTTI|nr:hypothetical protein [Actinoplanes teichomyceticus]TWG21167.1 hypothetical protein FHX34_103697 [Actinoplanes teichomyceticus]GIF14988.1 hypothetical protein Ate01nite_50200 [Actinoplanes teichomyceticus]